MSSLKGNTRKINELNAELTIVINEGGISEEILDIESRIKDQVDEDLVNYLKNRKNYNILDDESPRKDPKKGYNEVIFLNKDNPNYDQQRLRAK